MIALVARRVIGWAGAALASEPRRPPIVAVAAPLAMLVAEAIFQVIDRKVWRYNLTAETYRLIDPGVIVGLLLVGLVLPVFFEKDRRRRGLVYLVVALAGVGGAFGLVLLRSLIVSIAWSTVPSDAGDPRSKLRASIVPVAGDR